MSLSLTLLFALVLPAAHPQPAESLFALREVMIPMRDGVRLYTRILTPSRPSGPLPFMFIRTPYGIAGSGSGSTERFYGFLLNDGYIFVYQDIRGKFKSEGQFVMQRPPRTNRGD